MKCEKKEAQDSDKSQLYILCFSPKSIALVAIGGYNGSPII